jgi:hypothetical protein
MNAFKEIRAGHGIVYILCPEAGQDALTRLFQAEMIKHNQWITESIDGWSVTEGNVE